MTVGENELAPPVPALFSVGCGAFDDGDAGALELCDGVLVSAGFSLVSLLQALSAPMPTMAAAPATRANCRVTVEAMRFPTLRFQVPD